MYSVKEKKKKLEEASRKWGFGFFKKSIEESGGVTFAAGF